MKGEDGMRGVENMLDMLNVFGAGTSIGGSFNAYMNKTIESAIEGRMEELKEEERIEFERTINEEGWLPE